MGAQGVDVQLSAQALKEFPFSIECKNLAKVAIYKHYEQATANAIKDTKPLLIIKQNRSQPLAVLSLEDFLDVCRTSSRD